MTEGEGSVVLESFLWDTEGFAGLLGRLEGGVGPLGREVVVAGDADARGVGSG